MGAIFDLRAHCVSICADDALIVRTHNKQTYINTLAKHLQVFIRFMSPIYHRITLFSIGTRRWPFYGVCGGGQYGR